MSITLSYVLTTYNKLPYLKEAMKRLIANCLEDEEIVVADGASTDGTPEYLQELYSLGKIHQYISEKDFGEAHGFNKGILMAKGELVKLLSDDDIFYNPGIQLCKGFMLTHPEIDVLSTSGAATDWENKTNNFFFKMGPECEANYKRWLRLPYPFAFCGLGLMLRKSSIPLIGLLYTNIVRVDYEFGMRVTSGKINLAWYTGNCYVRVSNPHSNSVKMSHKMIEEEIKINAFYLNVLPEAKDTYNLKSVLPLKFIKQNLKNYRNLIYKKYIKNTEMNQSTSTQEFSLDWAYVYDLSDQWLTKENSQNPGEFLYKHT